mmetsp:Transcript_15607/g.26839  ORF Transcript_15607/g.26839 Transcript_15607/m.26839 type:complete len:96 (-) Transcript_15607:46-333(-)
MPHVITRKMNAFKIWFGDAAAYPVMAVVLGGCAFGTWFSVRTLRTHNDVIVNKHKPYQYRVAGNTPKILTNGAVTDRNLRYDEQTKQWKVASKAH